MAAGVLALAQSPRGFFGVERSADPDFGSANVPYDGRFTFVRLRYPTDVGGFRREPPWLHDYPTADTHLAKIVKEISKVDARVDGSNIFSLKDPELTKYPIAYMSEPGFWLVDEEEAVALAALPHEGRVRHFRRFSGEDWYNFEAQMRRVMPEGKLVLLDASSPIFHSFFEIEAPESSCRRTAGCRRDSMACSRTTIRPSG